MDFRKFFQTFGLTRRVPLLGPKSRNVAAEGYSPPQDLEKAARRAAIFLVCLNMICPKTGGKYFGYFLAFFELWTFFRAV